MARPGFSPVCSEVRVEVERDLWLWWFLDREKVCFVGEKMWRELSWESNGSTCSSYRSSINLASFHNENLAKCFSSWNS